MTARACKAAAAAAILIFALGCAGCVPAGNAATVSPRQSTAPALVTYSEFDDLSRALGFDMVQISGGGYEPTSFSAIDGYIGQIIYNKDDTELIVRMASGSGDITGVNGAAYTTQVIHGIDVEIGSFADIQVARFEINGSAYGLSATGMTPQFFEGLVTQVVDQMSDGQ